jgi:glucokinase
MTEPVRMVADVGGTNARFAVIEGEHGMPQKELTLPTIDFPNIADAAEHYLKKIGTPEILEGAVAIANPITGDWLKMTNHHWAFSIEETRQRLGFKRLLLINDFTALAMALPVIPKNDLRQIGGSVPVAGAALGLIGAGTGLGVSGLLPSGDGGWVPIAGEGGHVTLCAATPREAEIIEVCREEHGHVSAERLISGMGLTNLHLAIAKLAHAAQLPLTPAEVTQRGLSGSDALCVEALQTFCAFLGSVSGNLALTLGALGGIYIGGGIVPKLGDYFRQSLFRERFQSKGRFTNYMTAIPVYVIHARNPAFLGAAIALGVQPGT